MKVLVVGGGSAGHVIPALPVIDRIVQAGGRAVFVGTGSGLEENLVADSPAQFYSISAGKLRRYFSWENVTDLFRIAAGMLQAFRILGREKPDVVFSKGGFVAFPVVVAAWLRGIPVVAHESDLTPGLANRLCKPFAATICTSFPETAFPGFKGRVVHTGSPMRPELLEGDRARGITTLSFGAEKPILLVTGGSLGADALNAVVRDALPELTRDFNVVHVCGAGKLADLATDGYRQYEYVAEGWGDILAAADLVVSRAGANALFELLSLRKPSLLVPLSAQASRGDQIANAAYAEARGYVHVIAEADLDAKTLSERVRVLNRQRDELIGRLAAFATPDAVGRLCDEINAAAED